jgi:TetR/AcrR family transcriptional regulator
MAGGTSPRRKAPAARRPAEPPATDEADGGDDNASDGVVARTDNQRRILQVAIREFAEKGLAGARVAEIAEQAGVNKQLLYYYFESKDGLFSAALGHMVTFARKVMVTRSSDTYGDWLVAGIRPDTIERRHTLRRLWIWEALERGDAPIMREEERRDVWEQAVDLVRQAQAEGQIDSRFDPEMVMLAVDAMFNSPFMMPQVTELITDMDPRTEAFRERLREFMAQVFARMAPRA